MAKSKPKATPAATPAVEKAGTGVTKAQLVEAYNTMAEEPVTEFKSVKAGTEACQALANEYTADEILSVPEAVRAILTQAGVKLPDATSPEAAKIPKRRKGGWMSHCHERVYQALVDGGNKPITKEDLANVAGTTIAVVSNAFHDFRQGKHTPEGTGLQNVRCTRIEGIAFYSLVMPGDAPEEPAAKKEAKSKVKEALA
jgi:hypothetical protein